MKANRRFGRISPLSSAVFCWLLLHAGFLLGLPFDHEDGGHVLYGTVKTVEKIQDTVYNNTPFRF
jgi:hypothetical protein